jgi:hypothetical protein
MLRFVIRDRGVATIHLVTQCAYQTRRWLSLKDMAHQAGIAPFTLRALCRAGKVKARKVGGVWVVWADHEGLPIDGDTAPDIIYA